MKPLMPQLPILCTNKNPNFFQTCSTWTSLYRVSSNPNPPSPYVFKPVHFEELNDRQVGCWHPTGFLSFLYNRHTCVLCKQCEKICYNQIQQNVHHAFCLKSGSYFVCVGKSHFLGFLI